MGTATATSALPGQRGPRLLSAPRFPGKVLPGVSGGDATSWSHPSVRVPLSWLVHRLGLCRGPWPHHRPAFWGSSVGCLPALQRLRRYLYITPAPYRLAHHRLRVLCPAAGTQRSERMARAGGGGSQQLPQPEPAVSPPAMPPLALSPPCPDGFCRLCLLGPSHEDPTGSAGPAPGRATSTPSTRCRAVPSSPQRAPMATLIKAPGGGPN